MKLAALFNPVHATAAPLLAACLSLALLASPAWAIPPGMVEKGWEDTILQGIAKVSNTDYEDGLKLFDEYIKAFPQNGEGYFYFAVALQEKIQKLNDMGELDRFYKYSSNCKRIFETRLDKSQDDAIARMYLGAMNGYIGLVEGRQRNLLQAFMRAVDAKALLERAYKERPDIADTGFGLGMIYYFASRKSSEVGGMTEWIITKFITNGRDMRNEAVEMINQAIEGNALSRDYARAAIMWISLYDKNYPKAREMAQDIAKRYPKDAGSRWVLGRVALVNKQCAEAQARFGEALEILKKRGLAPARYQDVEMARSFATLCESIDHKEWEEAARFTHKIDEWLKHDPKITLEYQDEKNLIEFWRRELNTARRSQRFITGP
jgi:tetratricopeptide (TPR) repeat protein